MKVHDNKLELKLITQLMDQLQGEMEYDENDFASRLGRKKPGVEILKVEGKMPMNGMDSMYGKEDPHGDMEMAEDLDRDNMDMETGEDDDLSPEEMLEKRLLKLRG